MTAQNEAYEIKAYAGEEPYIFVSYASKDKDTVYPFLNAITQDSYRVWYDMDIPLGTRWWSEICKHVEQCAACIVFHSSNTIASEWRRKELDHIQSHKKSR